LITEPADTEKVQNFATAALCKTFWRKIFLKIDLIMENQNLF
jgi:hypothetical protein